MRSNEKGNRANLRKTLYTLRVDNYAPEICELTHPLLKRYAAKIGAEFFVIDKRKSPKLPPVYEKLQIYDIARERKDDWILFFDSDAVVHPDMPDVTEVLSMDTVLHNGIDFAACRYEYDDYFRRDGRHISSCNWFAVASKWCLDLWKPLDDLTFDEAVSRIKPTVLENAVGITREHLIDDFILSRNIAKYGLKVKTFRELLAPLGLHDSMFLWHQYTMPVSEKLVLIKKVLSTWTGHDFK